MRDVYTKPLVPNVTAPIVQRRSGKPRPPVRLPANRMLPFEVSRFAEIGQEPVHVLEAGKSMGRTLVAGLPDDQRIALARVFCATLVEAYWVKAQRSYRT